MSCRRRAAIQATAILLATLVLAPASAAGAQVPASTRKIADDGFGQKENGYSWSMAWFKGKLYVGTARSQYCVEGETLNFFKGFGYSATPGFELACPPDPYDLALRAEIWQYTPQTRAWKRVYQSPEDVPNPRAPGKRVARDIAYRGMVVFTERNGTHALYVGGLTTDEYIPELKTQYPPRILRTTDGEHFTALNGAPATISAGFGVQQPVGYRSMVSYRGRLFVTASGGLTGDGAVVEVKDPSGPDPRFVQISPDDMSAFELQVFDGRVYIGAGDADNGYSVWRTDAARSPKDFVPVVTDGAGRGKTITSVVSMSTYKHRLYVGSSGWGALFPQSELIRIYADDRWELVVGTPRVAGGTVRFPISGLPDGFGNVFNSHFWRQQEHGGALYLGTNDWSWAFRSLPILEQLFAAEFGFDLYGTCDGQYWWPATRDAFGDGPTDFGVRTLASTPTGAYLGTTNHVQGTSVWLSTDHSPCGMQGRRRPSPTAPSRVARPGARRVRGAQVATAAAAPRRLIADVQRCGTVLSWSPPRGATRYRILRADSASATGVRVPKPALLPGGAVPDVPPTATGSRGRTATVTLTGAFTEIGTTSKRFFVDRSGVAGRVQYQVVAQAPSGTGSGPSNLEATPSLRQPATFAAARAAIRGLGGSRAGVRAAAARAWLEPRLARAEAGWRRGDRRQAVDLVSRLRDAVRVQAASNRLGDAQARARAIDTAYRLDRRLRYDGMACSTR